MNWGIEQNVKVLIVKNWTRILKTQNCGDTNLLRIFKFVKNAENKEIGKTRKIEL